MALKDLNFKQLLLQKGERIGLIAAAVVLAALVVGFGLASVMGNTSPGKNLKDLQSVREQAQQKRDRSQPDLTKPEFLIPADIQSAEKIEKVPLGICACTQPFFLPVETADRKWRMPQILTADEFHVDVVRGAVQSYVLSVGRDGKISGVGVIAGKAAQAEMSQERLKAMEELQKKFAETKKKKRSPSQIQLIPGQFPGVPGQPGLPGQLPPGLRGREGMQPGLPGMRPGQQGVPAELEQELRMIPVEKLKDENAQLAQTTLPVRMVIVTASFPFQKQLEEYRKALRFNSVDDLLRDPSARPEFAGFSVQRRAYGPDGKLVVTAGEEDKEGWADLDVDKDMKFLLVRSVERVPDNPELDQYGLIVRPNRLVMPRPKLAFDQKYPEPQLEGIVAAAKKVVEDAQGNVPPPKAAPSRFEDADVYDDNPPDGQRPGDVAGERMAPERGGPLPKGARPGPGKQQVPRPGGPRPDETQGPSGQLQRSEIVPEKCLIRFIDSDPKLSPGFTYEYRIRIRMNNPNYEQTEKAASLADTKEKEIAGPWQVVAMVTDKEGDQKAKATRVAIDDELKFYAVDEKPEKPENSLGSDTEPANPQRLTVQIHRWLDYARTKYGQKETEVPVGDWSILERHLVHRGEYLGVIKEVLVPIFSPTRNREDFAVSPEEQKLIRRQGGGTTTKYHKHKGIPIDFATDPVSGNLPLLVDFDGGERLLSNGPNKPPTKEVGPVEMLVLDANGKLVVQNSREDTDDPVRKERHTAWKAKIESVRNQAEEKKSGSDSLFTAPRGKGKGGS